MSSSKLIKKERSLNKSQSSKSMIKAATLLATISLTEGFQIHPNPTSALSSHPSNVARSSPFSSGKGTQHNMVLMDIGAVIEESGYRDDDGEFNLSRSQSLDKISKVSGFHAGDTVITSAVKDKKEKFVSKKVKLERKRSTNRNMKVTSAKGQSSLKSRRATLHKTKLDSGGKYAQLSLSQPLLKASISKKKKQTRNKSTRDLKLGGDLKVGSKQESSAKATRSRSSTMPGMAYHNTMRVKAYQDGLEIAEEKSGHRIIDNKSVVSRKGDVKKRNSEQMYGQSPSVPDSLIQFVSEIHQEARITPAEELELGSKTQEAIRLQDLYENLEVKLKREPTDDEYCAAAGKINMEALRQTIEEGNEAKNRLVTSNLRMVQRVVNLYLRNGLGSEYNAGDLMQDGTVALIRAAEKYEPKRGFRFSTYAMYWIRSSVKRSQILQSRVIDVPQRLHEHYKKIQKFIKEYEQTFGNEPELSDIAQAMNLSEVQVERCIKALEQRIYSLDAEITNPSKVGKENQKKETMYNIIQNKFDDVEMAAIERKFMKDDLIRSLRKHLPPSEVDLLLLRYGLIDEKTLPHGFSGPLTISEVSRLVGIKPDKVRRMLNNSLRQLKHVIGNEWEKEVL